MALGIEDRVREALVAEAEHLPTIDAVRAPVEPRHWFRRLGPLVAVASFGLVLSAGLIWALVARDLAAPVGVQAPSTTAPTVSSTTPDSTGPTTTEIASQELIRATVGEALLYYPKMIPADLFLCEEVINLPTQTLTLCDPGRPDDRKIRIRIVDAISVRPSGEAIPDHFGWRLDETPSVTTIYAPAAGTWLIEARSVGMLSSDVVEMLDSIPVFAERDALLPGSEPRLTLSDVPDDVLAGLVPDPAPTVVRERDDGAFIVFDTPTDARVTVHVGYGPHDALLEALAGLTRARLVPGPDRPVLVGATRNQTQAWWIQRGLLWSLLVDVPYDTASSIAIDMINEIDKLE